MRDPVKLESMTAVFQNKVRGTARIDESDTAVGTPQPRDGSGPVITNMTPVASKRLSGNFSPVWPANTGGGGFMFYGKK